MRNPFATRFHKEIMLMAHPRSCKYGCWGRGCSDLGSLHYMEQMSVWAIRIRYIFRSLCIICAASKLPSFKQCVAKLNYKLNYDKL